MYSADEEALYQHVDFLTSIRPYRNYKNLESLRKAADYIEVQLATTGLPPHRQSWEAKGNIYENVMVSFQPEKKKRFVLGAHYDVYKDQPGADDNASSVAGLIEIARIIVQQEFKPDYGIDFVSYCLEEPPFFRKKEMGSYVHAQHAYDNQQEIIGMISMEMIGYYRDEKDNPNHEKNYLTVSGIKKYDQFNAHLSNLLKAPNLMDSRRISYADNYRNNGPSDHRNYWKFDYPAAMVIGTGQQKSPHYHSKTDEIDTLNFDIMAQAVKSITYAVLNFEKVLSTEFYY